MYVIADCVLSTHKVKEFISEPELMEKLSSEPEMWGETMLEEKISLHLKAKLVGFWFEVVRYKTDLVAKGYVGKESMDCNKVLSYVSKHSSTHTVLAMVAQFVLNLVRLDEKIVFLHGDLIKICLS